MLTLELKTEELLPRLNLQELKTRKKEKIRKKNSFIKSIHIIQSKVRFKMYPQNPLQKREQKTNVIHGCPKAWV